MALLLNIHGWSIYLIFQSCYVAVRLLSNVTFASESDAVVVFTLVSSFPSDDPFTVQVFTMQRNRTTATSTYVCANEYQYSYIYGYTCTL